MWPICVGQYICLFLYMSVHRVHACVCIYAYLYLQYIYSLLMYATYGFTLCTYVYIWFLIRNNSQVPVVAFITVDAHLE
jgi:hypothetical protein